MAFITVVYDNISIDTIVKLSIIGFAIGVIFFIIMYFVFIKIPKAKTHMKKIVYSEVIIIGDILRGKETDTQKILEKYTEIWSKIKE